MQTMTRECEGMKPLLMHFTPKTPLLENFNDEIIVYDGITQTVCYNFATKKSTMSMKSMSTKHGKGVCTTSDTLKKKDD